MLRKCVLVVDDDEDACTICRELLQYHGYTILVARDGAAGIALARANCPDLVIVDLRLQVHSGMEVVSALRKSSCTASIPILLYTADVIGSKDVLAGAEISGLLLKPCSPSRVLQEVTRLIGGPELDAEGKAS